MVLPSEGRVVVGQTSSLARRNPVGGSTLSSDSPLMSARPDSRMLCASDCQYRSMATWTSVPGSITEPNCGFVAIAAIIAGDASPIPQATMLGAYRCDARSTSRRYGPSQPASVGVLALSRKTTG